MRDDDNAPKSVIPAPRSASYRICPVCTRGFGGRPPQQRCCSTRCAAEWMRKKRPDKKPPRFDVIEGRLSASVDTYDIDAQDAAWGERGTYWESVADSLAPRDRSVSLSVTGHGALMRVDGNSLIVRHGFTHHPQERIEQRYTPKDRGLPERIVLLSCDGSVTISALDWLAHQKVPVILLDRRGNLTASLVPSFAPFDRADIRKRLDNLDQSAAISLARYLIAKKLDGQAATAARFQASVTRAMTLTQLRNDRELLNLAQTIEDVRIVEARAAASYFKLWTRSAMRWKGLGRRPIPVEWFSIGLRGSAIGDSNCHATHPANAMLNYAYGCLQSRVSIACAASGIDPAAGVIHARRRGRPALIFDLMEPLRPLVDAAVLDFIQSQVFVRADFPLGSDGIVRLHPQLARIVSSLGIGAEAATGLVANFIGEVAKCGPTYAISG